MNINIDPIARNCRFSRLETMSLSLGSGQPEEEKRRKKKMHGERMEMTMNSKKEKQKKKKGKKSIEKKQEMDQREGSAALRTRTRQTYESWLFFFASAFALLCFCIPHEYDTMYSAQAESCLVGLSVRPPVSCLSVTLCRDDATDVRACVLRMWYVLLSLGHTVECSNGALCRRRLTYMHFRASILIDISVLVSRSRSCFPPSLSPIDAVYIIVSVQPQMHVLHACMHGRSKRKQKKGERPSPLPPHNDLSICSPSLSSPFFVRLSVSP